MLSVAAVAGDCASSNPNGAGEQPEGGRIRWIQANAALATCERRAGAAHAATLKAQAAAGSLRFEAFLPSEFAVRLLDLIEKGVFKDPSEAVFVMLGDKQDLAAYPDLRRELLRRTVEAAANDPRPAIPAEVVFAALDVMFPG